MDFDYDGALMLFKKQNHEKKLALIEKKKQETLDIEVELDIDLPDRMKRRFQDQEDTKENILFDQKDHENNQYDNK
jgi:hypothetical protein